MKGKTREAKGMEEKGEKYHGAGKDKDWRGKTREDMTREGKEKRVGVRWGGRQRVLTKINERGKSKGRYQNGRLGKNNKGRGGKNYKARHTMGIKVRKRSRGNGKEKKNKTSKVKGRKEKVREGKGKGTQCILYYS